MAAPVPKVIGERADDSSALVTNEPCTQTKLTASRTARQLSCDIIAIILEFILHDPDFGDNSRWLHRERSKEQWVRAHRVSF
jgi:hypothetical protein